jgi:hypothetical protein
VTGALLTFSNRPIARTPAATPESDRQDDDAGPRSHLQEAEQGRDGWLWKTCGDRHWQQLAAIAGQAVPDFRNADGQRVYAAFTAIGAGTPLSCW